MSQKGGKAAAAAAKGKKPGGKAGAEEKHEDALQAVVSVSPVSLSQSNSLTRTTPSRFWQITSRTGLCPLPSRSQE